jgi:hypothetical protein
MSYYRRLVLLFGIFFGLLIAGCQKQTKPDEVALDFMHAIQQSNFEQAKEYATKESHQVITLYSIFDGRRTEDEREKIKHAEIKVLDTKEDGDKATVTILNSSAKQEETLQLIKESGKWKISLTFESIIPNFPPPGSMDSTSIEQMQDSVPLLMDSIAAPAQ